MRPSSVVIATLAAVSAVVSVASQNWTAAAWASVALLAHVRLAMGE